jgi:hypothetical protein
VPELIDTFALAVKAGIYERFLVDAMFATDPEVGNAAARAVVALEDAKKRLAKDRETD